MPRVLIVEDEAAIAELISVNLKHNGLSPIWAEDGESAQREIDAVLPDVILLDWMLPGQHGVVWARKWRSDPRTKSVPILMLTAKSEEHDKVSGLDAGADDYIGKPFYIDELLARIQAIIKRSRGAPPQGLVLPGLKLDEERQRVTTGDGKDHDLTGTEFRMLRLFMLSPGRVLSKSYLLEHVYGADADPESNTLEVYIKRLRHKIGETRIQTRRGQGYVLLVEPE